MKNRYVHVQLPSWVESASREKLIAHMQYLTSTITTTRKALAKARYRMGKAESKLKQLEVGAKNDSSKI